MGVGGGSLGISSTGMIGSGGPPGPDGMNRVGACKARIVSTTRWAAAEPATAANLRPRFAVGMLGRPLSARP